MSPTSWRARRADPAAGWALALLLAFAISSPAASPPDEVARDARMLPDRSALRWSAVPGAAHYNVYMGTLPARQDHACFLAGVDATQAPLDTAPPGQPILYFLVSAVNGPGESTLGFGAPGERPNTPGCDTDGDTVADGPDNCPRVRNPPQADQDEDGEGDRCDPQTYDFEADAPGGRPAETTQVGGADATFVVADLGGDLGVAYAEAAPGVHDRLDRVEGGYPFQDTTVYLDYADVAEVCTIELWSEGAWGWNAGSGIIVQVGANGQVYYYDRRGQAVPQTPGPIPPATGRIRLRLVKGPGLASTLHLDGWDGSAWQTDLNVLPVADDHLYRGLSTVLANYIGGRRPIRRITVNHEIPAGAFLLRKHASWSADWKVFQRDAVDAATIPLRFHYRQAEPGRLYAQVVDATTGVPLPGHGEADHQLALPASPSGGAEPVSGSYDVTGVPAGGNYDVEVRLERDSDGATLGGGVLEEVAVGDVFVVGGQSNMSGYSGGLGTPETPRDEVHLFHNDGTWKLATEPMDDGTDQVDLVSREDPAHSLMLRFAKDVQTATGVPVGIIPGPLGGTNLFSQWQRDASDHDNRGTLYGSLLHRTLLQGYETPPVAFLWFQGESDALSLRGTDNYRADLLQLVAQMREDLGHPGLYFLNAQLGVYTASDLGQWLAIQEAERQVAAMDPLAALVTTVDQPLADPIHFNVDGYKTIGARFAEAARALIYGEPIDHLAEMTEARIGTNGNEVELVYDAGVTGGATEMYYLWDDLDFDPVVLSVATAGNVVTVEVDRDLVGQAFVSYGFSHDPAGAWVEDLQGVPVPCFSTVAITR